MASLIASSIVDDDVGESGDDGSDSGLVGHVTSFELFVAMTAKLFVFVVTVLLAYVVKLL